MRALRSEPSLISRSRRSTCECCVSYSVRWVPICVCRLCGLTRPRANAPPVLITESPYWIYRYDRPELPGTWTKILPEKETDVICPHPRYAHQVVYDCKSGLAYMHGGNAGLWPDEEEHEAESRPSSSEAEVEARSSPPRSPLSPRDADSDAERRLDDFWSMEIVRYALPRSLSWTGTYNRSRRPSNEEIVRRALYEIRQQQ